MLLCAEQDYFSMIGNILISFLTSIAAVLVALWIERLRQPSLQLTVGDDANHDEVYKHAIGGRWKFFRVRVSNKEFPSPFKWIPRYPAQGCTAQITFTKIESDKRQFQMLGRWASTLELATLPPELVATKVFYPDTVSISPNESELLDIIAKSEKDKHAFGWNNESYLFQWRPPRLLLDVGNYKVDVVVLTQNGVRFSKTFACQIAEKIEETTLLEIKK